MTTNFFQHTRFLLSVPDPRDLPSDVGAEIAIVGRSNVGKSSLLNAICAQRSLARTSRTPGRTQQIVVFEISPQRRFLDLPGFGYAAVSRELRAQWEATIPELLERRSALCGMLLVTDARMALQDGERRLVQWCSAARMPCLLALNKADKLGRAAALGALRAAEAALDADALHYAGAVLSSATKRVGLETLRPRLQAWLDLRLRIKEGPGLNT